MSNASLYCMLSSVDCVSKIVNECELQRVDIGHCRGTSKCLLRAIESTLECLEVQQIDVDKLCGILGRLPALRHLKADGLFSNLKTYAELSAVHAQLQQQLAAHTRLVSLTISSRDLKHLGALKWAHQVAAQATNQKPRTPGSSRSSGSSCSSRSRAQSRWYRGEYESLAYDSQHEVYWLPDWLAAPPVLSTLIISSAASSNTYNSSSSTGAPTSSASTPACLWLHPSAWCSKLTALHIHGIPFQDRLPPSIAQLTRLRQLALTGCALQPKAAVQLVRQVGGSCKGLQVLQVTHGDLWQLPRDGWEALAGLKELDFSYNQLVTLPGGVGHLTQLTRLQLQHNQLTSLPLQLSALAALHLLDVSNNWLSGLRAPPGLLAKLVAGWPHLEVLRLQNVSDKRGSLLLPAKLAGCAQLREVALGHNFDLDGASLEVLGHCKALEVVDLSGTYKPAAATDSNTQQLLTGLQSKHVHVLI